MSKRRFTKSDLVAFLEDLIEMDTATQEEMEYYEDFHWTGELKVNYTYKKIVRKMKREYMGN